jgi:deoxyribodipyrimidine photolyase-related protein
MIILLGNMLFPNHSRLPMGQMPIFMAEDQGLCRHYRYHKHKLILILAAMRHQRDALRQQGETVEYSEIDDPASYEEKLLRAIRKYKISVLHTYTIEDHWFQARIQAFCKAHQIKFVTYDSPLFLTTQEEFQTYRDRHKRLFMGDFYKYQRRRLNILLDPMGEPEGGKWSYDDQNRKPLPKSVEVPLLHFPEPTAHVQDVVVLIDRLFPDHPGKSENFWLPVTSTGATDWLHQFLSERLAQFGPYEDALTTRDPFVFHSVLSPLLNLGLITPLAVVTAALEHAHEHPIPLNSLEGFLRQIIGWREYIRGVYHAITPNQRHQNKLKHTRRLTADWYNGTTGLLPVDQVIGHVQSRGWAHHIERLMVISNAMLLAEVHPDDVFQWFMELFVDSADWVMVPNVYGMGQFADGGQMMTKPYVSGSSYLRKMGDYPKGEWCDIWDGLYWRFVDRKKAMLTRNPRLSIMVKTLEKLNPERKQLIFTKAEAFIQCKTVENRVI